MAVEVDSDQVRSPIEQLLRTAFSDGTWVDLTAQQDRRVPADVIAGLLLGAGADATASPAHHRVPALRLRGAEIVGVLDVAFGQLDALVHVDRCTFDQAPDLSGAATRTVRLTGCTLPGLVARLVRVGGDLDLSESTVTGQLMVEDGAIEGSLLLRRATLDLPGGRALAAGGVALGAGFFARDLTVVGEARLIGARLDGGLFLSGARLSNPGGVALGLDSVQARWVTLRAVDVDGEVRLRGARVDGAVDVDDAVLRGTPLSIRARGLQAGDLQLTPAHVEGTVDLSQARIGALRDRSDRRPPRLRLDGLTYDHLLSMDPESPEDSLREHRAQVRDRCRWLSLEVDGYRPQPYEQLAAYYRRLGHDDDARRVLLAKLRRRRADLPPMRRIGGYLADALVGYGYRPWLAAMWGAVLLIAGTLLFSVEQPRALEPAVAPRFSAFVYSLDLIVPIAAFGQRAAYDPVGWTHWVADVMIAAGWVVATAMIAGVSRSVGRD